MRPHRMNLGDDPHRRPRLRGRQSGPLAGQPGANHQNVMLRHRRESLRKRRRNPTEGGEPGTYIEGYECGFVWREQRLIVATDGGTAHGTARAMKRDPVRDADLMIPGWRIWRLSCQQLLSDPDTVVEQLIRLGITPAQRPAARAARRRS